jgi:hypothetical protein
VFLDGSPDSSGITGHSGLSGGAIGGITIAVVAAVFGMMLLLIWRLRPDLIRNPFNKDRPQGGSPEKPAHVAAGGQYTRPPGLMGNATSSIAMPEMAGNSLRYELSGVPAQPSELPVQESR